MNYQKFTKFYELHSTESKFLEHSLEFHELVLILKQRLRLFTV